MPEMAGWCCLFCCAALITSPQWVLTSLSFRDREEALLDEPSLADPVQKSTVGVDWIGQGRAGCCLSRRNIIGSVRATR